MQVLDGVVNDEAQTYIRGGGGDTIDTSKSCDMAKPSSRAKSKTSSVHQNQKKSKTHRS